MDDLSQGALRELVREVLRDVLPGLSPSPAPASPAPAQAASPAPAPAPPSSVPRSDADRPAPAPSAAPGGAPQSPGPHGPHDPRGPRGPRGTDGVETVRLSTNAELHEFVLRLLRLADNPRRRADIVAGRLRFELAATGGAAGTSTDRTAIQRVDKGAVTERTVVAAAGAGVRLVLGPRAVLTPLARDKARALGVPVEKER